MREVQVTKEETIADASKLITGCDAFVVLGVHVNGSMAGRFEMMSNLSGETLKGLLQEAISRINSQEKPKEPT